MLRKRLLGLCVLLLCVVHVSSNVDEPAANGKDNLEELQAFAQQRWADLKHVSWGAWSRVSDYVTDEQNQKKVLLKAQEVAKNFQIGATELAGHAHEKGKKIAEQIQQKSKVISGQVQEKTKEITTQVQEKIESPEVQQQLREASEMIKSASDQLLNQTKHAMAKVLGEDMMRSWGFEFDEKDEL